MIQRFNPAERKQFARPYFCQRPIKSDWPRLGEWQAGGKLYEPALGTLDERLDILVRRLGGKTGPVRMTAQERRDYERFLAEEESA